MPGLKRQREPNDKRPTKHQKVEQGENTEEPWTEEEENLIETWKRLENLCRATEKVSFGPQEIETRRDLDVSEQTFLNDLYEFTEIKVSKLNSETHSNSRHTLREEQCHVSAALCFAYLVHAGIFH